MTPDVDRERAQQWHTGGAAYERYVGRWSRPVAQRFLDWLEVPLDGRWLDVGCGTGALTETILEYASPARVQGIDPSQAYVEHAEAHLRDSRASFRVGDVSALRFEDGCFDAAVAGLVLNFVAEPQRAVREMARVTRIGGTVGAYVWDYADGMELMRHFWDAVVELEPAAAELDEGRRFPIASPERLSELFAGAGLADVAVRAIDIPTVFASFDDYWEPFLGGQGPAGAYAASLDEARCESLRDLVRARLPIAPGGSLSLTARAFAVRGRR